MALDPRGVTRDYDSGAAQTSGVIKTSPGRLYNLWGFSNKASSQYIQVFNTAAVPADTAVPAMPPLYVAATSAFFYDFGELGVDFTTGLCWSNSSTFGTKTLGAGDVWLHAAFR